MAKSISWPAAPALAIDARGLLASVRLEPVVVLALIAIGVVSHGLNMFQFPSFTGIDDEGIYASQAWAILREGQLSPYTYVYDHVPGGWIVLAAWMGITGGPHAFGGAIDSGRVLMLLLHVASLVMLYRVARKLGCGIATAAFGTLLFTVSPLALEYQRRLLLDNIMVFWSLLSLDLLLDGWGRLSRVTLSGICFGVALLTKETAIVLLPAMLYIAWQQRWEHQARFAVFGWLVPALVVMSWYPLYAALKGELLPAGGAAQFSTTGYGNTGVSLIDSLLWQIARDGGGPFNFQNQFWSLVRADWLPRDGVLLVGGAVATVANLAWGFRARSVNQRRAIAAVLLAGLPVVYLARGGIVFDFYIVFAIPFLCLSLAVLLTAVVVRVHWRVAAPLVSLVCLGLIVGYVRGGELEPLYAQAPSTAGREALAWIKTHVPPDSAILTGDGLWTDLREPGPGPASDAPGFAHIQSYTKVAGDPAIREGVFHDDWHNVDYLVVTPGLEESLVASDNQVALDALHHAQPVKSWTSDGTELALWKVDRAGATESSLLNGSNAWMEWQFDRAGGMHGPDGSVTSESQAYAMLRAVWSGNRDQFAQSWAWTQSHLLNEHSLLAWHWNGSVRDAHSAADADSDAALALLMAGRRWPDSTWLQDGKQMVNAIWTYDVAQVHGKPYVVAGDWTSGTDPLAVNPSYFAPYAYHIFKEADPDHDWLGVVDSGYQMLFDSSAALLGGDRSAGLPPDWVGLDPTTTQLAPIALGTSPTTLYGFDAPRTYWRVALDLRWNSDGRAAAFLADAGFVKDEVMRTGAVRAIYAHDGAVDSTDTSTVGSAGALGALMTLDPDAANLLYASQVVGNAETRVGRAYWGDASDLYTQEWGWFATALYANTLDDLWHAGGH